MVAWSLISFKVVLDLKRSRAIDLEHCSSWFFSHNKYCRLDGGFVERYPFDSFHRTSTHLIITFKLINILLMIKISNTRHKFHTSGCNKSDWLFIIKPGKQIINYFDFLYAIRAYRNVLC